MKLEKSDKLAIWAITPNGARLAEKISKGLPDADMHFSALTDDKKCACFTFRKLSETLPGNFYKYQGHIFIMSTGIVVRLIAPHLRHKTEDPAVVVADEMGHHAISLLSGHIGGANALAKKVAETIHATPVITTATDLSGVLAIDVLAKEQGLFIENPQAIKHVSMALLTGKPIDCHDPFGYLSSVMSDLMKVTTHNSQFTIHNFPGVFIDDIVADLAPTILILRPKSLIAGIGCNRNTDKEEIRDFLFETLERNMLAGTSLKCIASADLKADEPGLLELAGDLDIPAEFFPREALDKVEDIKTPSAMVEKHIGVKSVCEAAAIIGANRGKLIVPKQVSGNVTVAIARIAFTS